MQTNRHQISGGKPIVPPRSRSASANRNATNRQNNNVDNNAGDNSGIFFFFLSLMLEN